MLNYFIYVYMKEKYIRIKYLLLYNLHKLWSEYKIYILVLSVFFLIGFVTGILTCSGYSKDLSPDNIINIYLLDFLKRDLNWISLFLIISIYFILLCFLTVMFVRNKLMLLIMIIISTLLLYIFGFDLCVLIVCLGLSGIFFGIVFYGIIGLLIYFLYIIMLSIISKSIISKKINDRYCNKVRFKECVIFSLIGVILIFFMVFFFSVIHIFVIIE